MAKAALAKQYEHHGDFSSPHDGLVYRSLVHARNNGQTALYFVAGVQGGPWNANRALLRSFKRHGGNCFYCKTKICADLGTIDHVEPTSLGGNGELPNLVLACKPCNVKKGHIPIDAFNPGAGKAWLEALLHRVQERLNRLNPPS